MRPLFFGRNILQNSGAWCRENAELCSACHALGSSSSAIALAEGETRWRSMTALVGAGAFASFAMKV
jgi:hypothetical protein